MQLWSFYFKYLVLFWYNYLYRCRVSSTIVHISWRQCIPSRKHFPDLQRLEHYTVMCGSERDMVTQVSYQTRQKSTEARLAVLLVSEVTLDLSWALLSHCHLKSPSVRPRGAGGGPPGFWLKWWAVKLRRRGGNSWLLPTTLSFNLSAGRENLLSLPVLPVTVNAFVLVDKNLRVIYTVQAERMPPPHTHTHSRECDGILMRKNIYNLVCIW